MNILHVASEMYPLIKTGGLADVVGALPLAQRQTGQDARVLLPAYPSVLEVLSDCPIVAVHHNFAGEVTLRYGEFHGVGIYLLDVPHLYARHGNPYYDENYQDYSDNYLRFALLGYMGAILAEGLDRYWRPDVLHVHDWHAGLACAYTKYHQLPTKTVFTIHNIAYHGCFDARHLSEIALPESYFHIDGLEFHGQLSYLKAGIFYADEVTTVSPTFAKEIVTEDYGFGLHGLLKTLSSQGRLHGILNGIDENSWNPANDGYLPAHYKIGAMQGKAVNKKQLQQQLGLPVNVQAPLFVMVSRLTAQKGVDLFLKAIDTILENQGQIAVLGSGDAYFEQAFSHLANTHKDIAVAIGYNEELAHRLIAAGDVILVPSRFEPCGLTQLYGLKYGTLPLVRRTGGLADTVVHTDDETMRARTATGFVFDAIDENALITAIQSAFQLWALPRKWSAVRATAMRQDNTWQQVAGQYQALYDE